MHKCTCFFWKWKFNWHEIFSVSQKWHFHWHFNMWFPQYIDKKGIQNIWLIICSTFIYVPIVVVNPKFYNKEDVTYSVRLCLYIKNKPKKLPFISYVVIIVFSFTLKLQDCWILVTMIYLWVFSLELCQQLFCFSHCLHHLGHIYRQDVAIQWLYWDKFLIISELVKERRVTDFLIKLLYSSFRFL